MKTLFVNFQAFTWVFLLKTVNGLSHCRDNWDSPPGICKDHRIVLQCLVWPIRNVTILENCQKSCGACTDNALPYRGELNLIEGFNEETVGKEYNEPPEAAIDGIIGIMQNTTGDVIEHYFNTQPLHHCFSSSDAYFGYQKNSYRWLCIQVYDSSQNLTITTVHVYFRPAVHGYPSNSRTAALRNGLRFYLTDRNCYHESLRTAIVQGEFTYTSYAVPHLCGELKTWNPAVTDDVETASRWTLTCHGWNIGYQYLLIASDMGMQICEVVIPSSKVRCSLGYYEVNGACRPCAERCFDNATCPEIESCPQCTYFHEVGKTCAYKCPKNCAEKCDRWSGVCLAPRNIYHPCQGHYYGAKCQSPCFQCATGCHHRTGICDNLRCRYQTWGNSIQINCKNNCSDKCSLNYCYPDDGYCHFCKTGYGVDCEIPCPSHCTNNECNGRGGCISCQRGYYGDTCQYTCLKCSHGCDMGSGQCVVPCSGTNLWGSNCDQSCPPNCRTGGCDPFRGTCNEGCEQGFYGLHCNFSCAEQCQGGHCTGSQQSGCAGRCNQFFHGVLCNQDCPGQCINGCESFNSSYKCTGCPPGKAGSACTVNCQEHCRQCDQMSIFTCTECPSGYFGKSCQRKCSLGCLGKCDIESGVCTACKPGYWGKMCTYQCQSCRNLQCHRDTGACLDGCDIGFYGVNCTDYCPENCLDFECTSSGECMYGCKDHFTGPICNGAKTTLQQFWIVGLLYFQLGFATYLALFALTYDLYYKEKVKKIKDEARSRRQSLVSILGNSRKPSAAGSVISRRPSTRGSAGGQERSKAESAVSHMRRSRSYAVPATGSPAANAISSKYSITGSVKTGRSDGRLGTLAAPASSSHASVSVGSKHSIRKVSIQPDDSVRRSSRRTQDSQTRDQDQAIP